MSRVSRVRYRQAACHCLNNRRDRRLLGRLIRAATPARVRIVDALKHDKDVKWDDILQEEKIRLGKNYDKSNAKYNAIRNLAVGVKQGGARGICACVCSKLGITWYNLV